MTSNRYTVEILGRKANTTSYSPIAADHEAIFKYPNLDLVSPKEVKQAYEELGVRAVHSLIEELEIKLRAEIPVRGSNVSVATRGRRYGELEMSEDSIEAIHDNRKLIYTKLGMDEPTVITRLTLMKSDTALELAYPLQDLRQHIVGLDQSKIPILTLGGAAIKKL